MLLNLYNHNNLLLLLLPILLGRLNCIWLLVHQNRPNYSYCYLLLLLHRLFLLTWYYYFRNTLLLYSLHLLFLLRMLFYLLLLHLLLLPILLDLSHYIWLLYFQQLILFLRLLLLTRYHCRNVLLLWFLHFSSYSFYSDIIWTKIPSCYITSVICCTYW